ncbi:MAG: helix-turn-helix domain-containing protein, partial [Chloroflexi bacterium]|nr:helix-turn-helix domain-containing protein [Chloroflexota bacterium]
MDATLSVTKAARLLGVHPNTVRAWSDAGRLRYYRINPRGDRRYRLGDLQRFLAAAENAPESAAGQAGSAGLARRAFATPEQSLQGGAPGPTEPERARRRADLAVVSALGRISADPDSLDEVLRKATMVVRERGDYRSAAIYE